MTASLSAYSLVNRNSVRFYLRNFPAEAGWDFAEIIISPFACHSCVSGNPALFNIRTYK